MIFYYVIPFTISTPRLSVVQTIITRRDTLKVKNDLAA